ncbi:uncharacterized protein L203_101716 [Cryptococcus depauperatus CBS 7841]|uniref:Uncharacterized protein n=1 Tax=Cryptococcus depauperatus CBS 7841 TaxID=1295531 RepID=A0AAJ8JQH0_9TREE
MSRRYNNLAERGILKDAPCTSSSIHLPSPPASTCSVQHPETDPWTSSLASISRHRTMNLSVGSQSALQASWREPPSVNLGSPYGDLPNACIDHGGDQAYDAGVSSLGHIGESPNRTGLDQQKTINKKVLLYGGREVLALQALARMMDSSKGRDKVLKCIQYALKTYLYLLSVLARTRPLSSWLKANSKRMAIAVSGLSLTRKCLLLLNPLHPLTDLLSPKPTSARTLLLHLVDLLGAIADDVFCLSKLGLVNKRAGSVASRWADRFWFLTTLIGLYKLHIHTIPSIKSALSLLSSSQTERNHRDTEMTIEEDKMRKNLREAGWSNKKLLADLAFVSYDVFNLNYPSIGQPLQCLTGLLSAYISTTKLYNQHWDASIGK